VLYGALGLQGLSVSLVDTAGLRKPEGRVEEQGIARGLSQVSQCDLAVLLVFSDSSPEEVEAWKSLSAPVPTVVVRGKADLSPGKPGLENILSVSGRTGEGVESLRAELVRQLWRGAAPEAAFAVSERIHQKIVAALEAAERAERAWNVSTMEVVAGELLLAHEAVAEVTGAGASTELLDEVFRRFCIGK
jgi:tRNA modification GTPase